MLPADYAVLLAEPCELAACLEQRACDAALNSRVIAELTASWELMEARKTLYSNDAAQRGALAIAMAEDAEALHIEDDLHNIRMQRDADEAVVTALKALVRLSAPGGL